MLINSYQSFSLIKKILINSYLNLSSLSISIVKKILINYYQSLSPIQKQTLINSKDNLQQNQKTTFCFSSNKLYLYIYIDQSPTYFRFFHSFNSKRNNYFQSFVVQIILLLERQLKNVQLFFANLTRATQNIKTTNTFFITKKTFQNYLKSFNQLINLLPKQFFIIIHQLAKENNNMIIIQLPSFLFNIFYQQLSIFFFQVKQQFAILKLFDH
ncbi:hypothetical protein TTHERM_000606959 (macronuclear) [Tetrahymena thermophila SB210]|uniref:Uncharacterized protein n=1 Tax=Tetrahymena thermophila (strain SB210) TaxID=312017 RepID=W7XG06_TETTS|nr:hypothetical protein TTHERM_000606959 [Tetrahymena thermophila SB210]EWS75818.1 hypothetical protein TTHERM_000606959 [Tetrahymena thermophila SB210]|eukprot:XP_012651632.1 hypothetical protein TTHERM_000606959 [Tetrahymena thermophila SB210]